MSVLARHLASRFVRAAAAVYAALTILLALGSLRIAVSRGGSADFFLTRLVRAWAPNADILLGFSAAVAALWLCHRLKQDGILVPLFAAGLRPGRVRLFLFVAAASTWTGSAVLYDVLVGDGEPADARAVLWRSDDVYVWRAGPVLDGPSAGLVLLRAAGPGLGRVERASRAADGSSYAIEPPVNLGDDVALVRSVRAPPPRRRALAALPIRRWFVGDASTIGGVVVAAGRWALGPLLLALACYLSLCTRVDRQAWAWVTCLVLVPAIGSIWVGIGILLWKGDALAWPACALLAVVTLGALWRLDRAFGRRGLRLTA